MRTFVIGDIHGCSKALQSLLEAIHPTPEDRLIFLGDYVDRGPDSRGVIDRLLELEQECQTVFLLGNHEIMFRGALNGLAPELWLQAGGSQTVTSYGGLLKNVSPSHIDFLYRCVPHFETENHIYVHANYRHELPLNQQPEETLFWEHLTDRVPEPHISGKHVFCGHTPQPGGNIGFFGHFTCLDTCCFGGFFLSAIEVESGEFWQFSKEGHRRETWRLLRKLAKRSTYFKRLLKVVDRQQSN